MERAERRAAFSPRALCFGPQRKAVTSKAKRKVLKCGRRAGKTMGVDIAMLEAARKAVDGAAVLYLTLTRANAKEIAWADLLRLNDKHHLGGVPNLTDLTLTMPSGGCVQLRGVNSEREIAKIRGKKFLLVVIDEAQSIPDRILRPLITEVIGPTLLDWGGDLWLVGTPPPVKAGYFWECYAGKLKGRWEQHHWNLTVNTELPARKAGKPVKAILKDVRDENGWDENHPTYRREYLGEDVEDLDALLYELITPRNVYDKLPEGGEWRYVFGIDIGHDDSDAIAVWGWQRGSRVLYLVAEFVRAGQDVTDLVDKLKELIPIYKPVRMAIDQGGLGKKIAEEIRRRHGINVQPAEKAQKGAHIKLMNADARKGLLKAKADSKLLEDCKLVQKDPKALAQGEFKELHAKDGGYHSDICDAALYGWRAALAYLEDETPAPPPPTAQQKLDAAKAKRLTRIKKRQAGDWWEGDAQEMGFE
jgi:hypothetical protein